MFSSHAPSWSWLRVSEGSVLASTAAAKAAVARRDLQNMAMVLFRLFWSWVTAERGEEKRRGVSGLNRSQDYSLGDLFYIIVAVYRVFGLGRTHSDYTMVSPSIEAYTARTQDPSSMAKPCLVAELCADNE